MGRLLAAPLLPRASVWASLGLLGRHAGSARVSLPASSPDSASRGGEESQKHAVQSAQAVDYLLALWSDWQPAGSQVLLAGPEPPIAFQRSDSAGSLSAHLAVLPEHFRLATVSVRMRPGSAAFRPDQ